ncbi:MAG: MarR family transcriptional regulator [Desulfatitalea sp.]|nr:MarR family transcriptional regulator [Desulfatitalea sp.]NNK02908.1 MarR family transcriptional regulator [Desulfatitalea sp.]
MKWGQFLQREMNPVCHQFGMKQQKFSVLNEIVWHGPISQKAIGETLLFEKSNISKIVKILFDKEWVRIETATHDRRLTLLAETPEGFAAWKACVQAFNQSSSDLEHGLDFGIYKLGPDRIKRMIQRKFGIELEIEGKNLHTITKEAQEIVYCD